MTNNDTMNDSTLNSPDRPTRASDTPLRNRDVTAGLHAGDERHSLQAYVSDLLALEQHIGQPLQAQLDSEDMAAFPEARSIVQQIQQKNKSHVAALQQCLEGLGGEAASPIKSAWASLLGGAASAIGGSRKTKVTKWLRDDYTALNLANISYTLLHATAVGLGNESVASIGRQGLTDYSRSVMSINQVIPDVVLVELRNDGENVATGAAESIRQQTNAIWKSQAAVTVN
jgi:ferritin-like metal-binding protein YciE